MSAEQLPTGRERQSQARAALFASLVLAGCGFAGLMAADGHEMAQNIGNYVAGIGVGGFIWGRRRPGTTKGAPVRDAR